MFSSMSVTSPTLAGEDTVNMIIVMIWFVSSIGIVAWLTGKILGD